MQYTNVKTKEKVKIVEDDGIFYVLNNGKRIDKMIFNQNYTINNDVVDVEEFMSQKPTIVVENKKSHTNNSTATIIDTNIKEVDPDSFFKTPATIEGVNDILNVDTSKISDVQQPAIVKNRVSDSTIIQEDLTLEEKQKRAIEEYNKSNPAVKAKERTLNENGLTDYEEQVRMDQIQLTGVDPYAEKIKKYRQSLKKEPLQQTENKDTVQHNETVAPINVESNNPSFNLFKNFKRNHDIVLKLNINEKISKPDFIKIMSDGLEGDIIQYYTDLIYNTFISNTSIIKSQIYEQIYEEVYGGIYDIKNLIEGKPTNKGVKRYKFISETGRTVDLTIETAKAKKLKPVR